MISYPLLISAPILGFIETIVLQQLLFRWRKRFSFIAAIVFAALGGWLLTVLITWEVVVAASFTDQCALVFMNSLISLGLSCGYLLFLGLNTTSLRIRILKELFALPSQRASTATLTFGYQPQEILERRLQRLLEKKQIRFENEHYYAQGTWIPPIITTITWLRWLILPKKS